MATLVGINAQTDRTSLVLVGKPPDHEVHVCARPEVVQNPRQQPDEEATDQDNELQEVINQRWRHVTTASGTSAWVDMQGNLLSTTPPVMVSPQEDEKEEKDECEDQAEAMKCVLQPIARRNGRSTGRRSRSAPANSRGEFVLRWSRRRSP